MAPDEDRVEQAEPSFAWSAATRRTYLAQERTLLAWWRTGLGAAAVALGVGAIIPHVADLPKGRFLLLGVGYGLLSVALIVVGALRDFAVRRSLSQQSYSALPGWVVIVAASYISVLVVLTVIAYL
jgi:uncharacterized membrane protein YidH (DUF202 family)